MIQIGRMPRAGRAVILGLLMVAWPTVRAQDAQDDEPYSLKATYEIEKGTRQGRIRIHVDMPTRWHTYSLSQPSPPGPTEIEVKKSESFRLTGPFAAEQTAKVTENDPIFGRLEEHYDEVDFIAPMEVAPGAKLDDLAFELKITCQVCSESTCEFIKKRTLEVEFDGYYEPKPAKKANEPTPRESVHGKGGKS